MRSVEPGLRLDPLHLFAVSVAALLAALLFLMAIVADVSTSTAAVRALVGWVVLSAIGIGIAAMVRWVLQVPPAASPASRLDVTLPATEPGDAGR